LLLWCDLLCSYWNLWRFTHLSHTV